MNLILPYREMEKDCTDRQRNTFEKILLRADTLSVLYDQYMDGCYHERNRCMVDKSDFLIAIQMKQNIDSNTQEIILMAKKKGIGIIIIDPAACQVERIPAKTPPKLIID